MKMNRREFVYTTGLGIAATTLPGRAADNKIKRPNLLIIQTDEHNFRTLGCYRKLMNSDQAMIWGPDAKVETPHIDSIAAQGATCTRCYATSPVCSPSRGAFVTGLYPQNTPVVQNNVPLGDDVITFAELLRKAGYSTGYAGKWHLDGGGKPQWEPERRFGFADNRFMYNRGHWKQLEITKTGPRVKARNNKGKPSYGCNGADEKSFTTDFLADRTIEFINDHKDSPFCYMVSIPDPHGPNSVRKPYDTMYDAMKFTPPSTMNKSPKNNPIWAKKQVKKFNSKLLKKYFGMVKCIDDNVGKILTSLRDNNLLDNTIVVFTSDHGDLCFEHARQNKGVPLEASAKIPFVISMPGTIKPNTAISHPMGTVDFLPTILGLMGVKTAGKEEGSDFSALFQGKTVASNKTAFSRACAANTSPTAWLAAIDDRYKLILCNACEPWLIDNKNDPNELTNHFFNPDHRKTVRRLAKDMQTYGTTCNDPFIQLPYLKHDLQWAANGTQPYKSPTRIT